jgi:hypothetical protein
MVLLDCYSYRGESDDLVPSYPVHMVEMNVPLLPILATSTVLIFGIAVAHWRKPSRTNIPIGPLHVPRCVHPLRAIYVLVLTDALCVIHF